MGGTAEKAQIHAWIPDGALAVRKEDFTGQGGREATDRGDLPLNRASKRLVALLRASGAVQKLNWIVPPTLVVQPQTSVRPLTVSRVFLGRS